jgi:hypothetical protein
MSQLAPSPVKSSDRDVGNGDSHLRIIPLSGLTNGERRSPEDIDVALIADIGCNLLDDPRNPVITEFGQVQFESPVVKHPRNRASIRRLIFRFLLVV